MPFNDKGEFIRSGRPPKRPAQAGSDTTLTWEDIGYLILGLLLIALLVGLLWILWPFRALLSIVFGLWLSYRCAKWVFSGLRRMQR
jgi:hypothetical protein